MILQRLKLSHFRSYTKISVVFSSTLTVIVGPNAAGKTNIIEAIYMCAIGKSFRARHDRETISWDQEVGRVVCETADVQLDLILTTGSVLGKRTQTKKFMVNGVARRMVDFVGNVKAVLFWPEHLDLVIDRPSVRRDYLDSVLMQTDRQYRRTLVSYQRGIRQRNRVLDAIAEGRAGRGQLAFWDELLIKAGGYITDARARFIEYVNTHHAKELTYQLVYDKSVISSSRLEQYKDAEIGAKVTLVGPHRDDMHFLMQTDGGRMVNLSAFGSRGQQRLAVLWLKLAELRFITDETHDKPLLLLDDIFSELDESHQAEVMKLVEGHQTIITTAVASVTDPLLSHVSGAKRIELPLRNQAV